MLDLICTLPLAASLFAACASSPPLAAGYVEGEYVLIASVETAQILSLGVARGDRVEQGQILAKLEQRDAEIAVARARAALAQAENRLGDLRHGRRPEEIDVIAATLHSARAQAEEAGRVVERQEDLVAKGIAPQSVLDDARTARDIALAAVEQAEANLAVAKLPARADQIAAAEASVAEAAAALESAEWRLGQRMLEAPSNGVVADIIRNPGELAGPQAPVLSVLPDGAVKLRLYVPEPALSSIATGTRMAFTCDGCGDGMTATVTYVADEPEFTPPVIYSLDSRQKLVWLIEARPDAGSTLLKPGQIVDAELPDADGGNAGR